MFNWLKSMFAKPAPVAPQFLAHHGLSLDSKLSDASRDLCGLDATRRSARTAKGNRTRADNARLKQAETTAKLRAGL